MRTSIRLLTALSAIALFDTTPVRAQDQIAAAPADDPLALDAVPVSDAAATPSTSDTSDAALLPTMPVADAAAPDAGPQAVERAATQQIEEIIVTATKRAQSLRDIPASITAISGQSLEDKGQLNLTDYIQKTPGLTIAESYAGLSRISIRGISTETVPNSPLPTPVGYFIGDTALTDPYLASVIPDLSAFDLSGVQVLKGPQGTLFGGAALSGAIRYELREPIQGEWQLRGFTQTVQPTGGSFAVSGGLAANVPLLADDNLALRVGYIRRNYPGVIDDPRTGREDVDRADGNQYRAILLWEPEDWKIKYTYLSQDFDARDTAGGIVTSIKGNRQNDLAVLESPAYNKIDLNSLELGYAFDAVRLVSLSSYLRKDAEDNRDATYTIIGKPPPSYPGGLGFLQRVSQSTDAFSQELRLQSTGSSPFQWLVGGYFYSYTMDFSLDAVMPATQPVLGTDGVLDQLLAQLGLDASTITDNVGLLAAASHVKSREKAFFVDLSYTLWDDVTLSAGARVYETTVDGGVLGTGLLVRAENNGMNADSSAELKEHGINPKFTATWHFTDNDLIYAQVAKGFRFGGIQITPSTATNGVPPTFKSDTLWNHEIGLRTRWLDRTLNADLTLFYIRYNNPIINQATQGIPLAYNDNVSSAISKGLEASVLWNTPLRGLSLSATAALTDAHITSPFTATGNVQVEPGQELPGTAPQQYGFSIDYLLSVGAIDIGVNAGYNYVGKGYSNLQHDLEINGYGTVAAGLIFSTDAWAFHPKLAINVSNLFNEVRASSGQVGQPVVPLETVTIYGLIPPRTVTARLSFDF